MKYLVLLLGITLLAGGCKLSPPTMEDWNAALTPIYTKRFIASKSGNVTISSVCFKAETSMCNKLVETRAPYSKVRRFEPLHQLNQVGPVVQTYVLLRDGEIPLLVIEAIPHPDPLSFIQELGVLINGDLLVKSSGNLGSIETKLDDAQLEALRKMPASATANARMESVRVIIHPGGARSETLVHELDAPSSQAFGRDLRAMISIHDDLKEALENVQPSGA